MTTPTSDRVRRRAPLTVAAAFGAAVAAGVGPLVAHLGILQPLTGWLLWVAGSAVCAGLLLVGVPLLLVQRKRRSALVTASIVLAPSAVLAVVVASLDLRASRVDVTTDGDDPPAFVNADAAAPGAADAGSDASGASEEVPALIVAAAPDRVLADAVALARELQWRVTRVDQAAREFEAVATTRVFRFLDDVAVRVRAHETGARIDMRSRSRFGRADLGTNAARIRDFLAQLADRLRQRSTANRVRAPDDAQPGGRRRERRESQDSPARVLARERPVRVAVCRAVAWHDHGDARRRPAPAAREVRDRRSA